MSLFLIKKNKFVFEIIKTNTSLVKVQISLNIYNYTKINNGGFLFYKFPNFSSKSEQ